MTQINVDELPVVTEHPSNNYHDTVEVSRHTLSHLQSRANKYERALQNCLQLVEQQEGIMFLTQQEAQHMAQIACNISREIYSAFSYPVMSCIGKTEKGDSFYKAKVVIKFDTSG